MFNHVWTTEHFYSRSSCYLLCFYHRNELSYLRTEIGSTAFRWTIKNYLRAKERVLHGIIDVSSYKIAFYNFNSVQSTISVLSFSLFPLEFYLIKKTLHCIARRSVKFLYNLSERDRWSRNRYIFTKGRSIFVIERIKGSSKGRIIGGRSRLGRQKIDRRKRRFLLLKLKNSLVYWI